MLHDLAAQGVEGDVFVIAAGDQDHLLREGAQARRGAAGAAGDGIVIVPHPLIGAHQLDTVLHAAEFTGKLPDGLIRHQTVHSGGCRHVILHIVDAGQLDIPGGHDGALARAVTADDGVAPQEHALFRLALTAEIHRPVGDALSLLPGDGVVEVENGLVARLLVAEDVLLGGHILRHVLMHVQMIGGQIGHHGDVGAVRHGHQLEAGQLQHRVVGGAHAPGLAQQGMADVAAHMDGIARLLQQLSDDGGSGGLSVAAGDGDDGAGAHPEEHLHLGGQFTALSHGLCQLGHIGPQARRAEDNVLIQPLQIVRA